MNKIKYFFQQSWLLIVAAFIFGVLIASANAAWREKIYYNLNVYKFNKLAKEVLPQAANFEDALQNMTIETPSGKKVTTNVKKALDENGDIIGWAFICKGAGFQDQIQLILVVDKSFEKIIGYGVLSSNETPGFGDKIKNSYYRDQFKGAPVGPLTLTKTGNPETIDSDIVAISGATVSSTAVVNIINEFLPAVKEKMQAEGLIGNE
ncbi:MAG: FMN-binding protein [Sedimentisphaerales bacterium]